MSKNLKLRHIAQLICPLSLLIILAFSIWLSPRGLDFSDEGYYLLAARYPNEVQGALSMWYLYTGELFKWLGYNIAYFRAVNILIGMFSLIVFALGAARLKALFFVESPANLFDRFIFVSFVALGLLGFSLLGFTPSYNTVSCQLVYIAAGLVLFALAKLIQQNKSYPTFMFFAGLALGAEFFTKFSSSVFLFGLSFLALFFLPQCTLRQKAYAFLALVLGIFGWLLYYFWLLQSPEQYWQVFSLGLSLDKLFGAGHKLSLIVTDIQLLAMILSKAFSAFWIAYAFLASFGLYIWVKGKTAKTDAILFKLVFVCLAVAIFMAVNKRLYLGGGLGYYFNETKLALSWIMLLAALSGFGLVYFKHKPVVIFPYYGFFLLIGFSFFPFIEALGTNNPIYMDALFYAGAWFVVIFALSQILAKVYKSSWLLTISLVFMALMTLAQTMSSFIYFYRVGSLFRQTQVFEMGSPSSPIKLSPNQAQGFAALQQAAKVCGFKPGQDILNFYADPGLVFLLGGKSPVDPWYYGYYSGAQTAVESILAMLPSERLQNAYILQDLSVATPQPRLDRFHLDFSKSYSLCGQVEVLDYSNSVHKLRLWKPKFS